MANEVRKVVLAYSGGLDTSVILRWLIETYKCEVIAFAADIGQREELDGLREKAISTGASNVYIDNLQEEFVRDFVFPALRANAIYEGSYLLGTSLSRPLIAKRQIEIARGERADAVSHGSTGKGNDQVRFELTYTALNPDIRIISAWRDPQWFFDSRGSMIDYAQKHHIPITTTREKPYSSDRNLLHISHEGGILEDPWMEPKEDMFVLTVSPEAAPDTATYVEIDFEKGNPVAINGVKMSPAKLLHKMNEIAGANGIGRVDLVENRFVGMKSRGVYETPGGTVFWAAHRAVGINGFKPFRSYWNEHPDRDEKWAADSQAQLGEDRFRREMCCEFLINDETLIAPAKLLDLSGHEPLYRTGQVRWYQKPRADRTYVISLDPSLGTGGDPAAIQIFEANTTEQIGEWRHNRTPIPEQIRILADICRHINETVQAPNNIYYSVENNTIGEAALISIAEYGEENIQGYFLSEPANGNGRRYRKGFNTTNKHKLSACNKMKSLIETGKMKIRSSSLVSELKTFVASGVSYAAKPGETDDLVMATVLNIRMLQLLQTYNNEIDNQLRDHGDTIIAPMPFISSLR